MNALDFGGVRILAPRPLERQSTPLSLQPHMQGTHAPSWPGSLGSGLGGTLSVEKLRLLSHT